MKLWSSCFLCAVLVFKALDLLLLFIHHSTNCEHTSEQILNKCYITHKPHEIRLLCVLCDSPFLKPTMFYNEK